jgi:hypothetical protein
MEMKRRPVIGGNGGFASGGGTESGHRLTAIGAYATQSTKLGTGFINPDSGAQVAVFGAEFNVPSASGWSKIDITGETASFNLASLASYREVCGAFTLMNNYEPNSGLVHRWYRDRDNLLMFEYYMPLPNPQAGWTYWWAWMFTYVGYCPWEFWENGNYHMSSLYVAPGGAEQLITNKPFSISGIPDMKIPVSTVEVAFSPANPTVGAQVDVTARVTNTSAGVYPVYFSVISVYVPASGTSITIDMPGQIGGGQVRNATGDFVGSFIMPAYGGRISVSVVAWGNNGTNAASFPDSYGQATVQNPGASVGWIQLGNPASLAIDAGTGSVGWITLGNPVSISVALGTGSIEWVKLGTSASINVALGTGSIDWIKLGASVTISVAIGSGSIDWIKLGPSVTRTCGVTGVVPPPGTTPGWLLPVVVVGGAALIGIAAASADKSGKVVGKAARRT